MSAPPHAEHPHFVRTSQRSNHNGRSRWWRAAALCAAAFLFAAARDRARPLPCDPIGIALPHVAALNAFWSRRVALCQSSELSENAVAFPRENRIEADGP